MNREFAGIFHSEAELLEKISELNVNGIAEKNMYVVTEHKDDVSIVRGKTHAEIQKADASWWERFTSFLSDEQPARKALHQMDLTEEEANRYLAAVQDGAFLLYVDKGDFWDATVHDRGDLTGDVEKKMDTSANIADNNDVVLQERQIEQRNIDHQAWKNKM